MDYLLKVSVVVAIFYLSYKLLLQRSTFFDENRWFLLMGLATAFIIPLLVIPIYLEYTPVVTSEYISSDVVVMNEIIDKSYNILDYLPILYGLGVLFFLVKFLMQLTSLSVVIFKNKKAKNGNFTFIETTKNTSPFSFFNWIIFNPNNFTKTELEHVIIHEKVHASQLHSIDVLVTQISFIILWFNPFIWLYRKDVRQNLEFIADKNTQETIDCKKSYQTTLLKASVGANQLTLINNFYNSLIKKRIVMLNKSKSKKINLLKYVFVIPLLALFLMNFNTKEVYVEKEGQIQENSKVNMFLEQSNVDEFVITDNVPDEQFKVLKELLAKKGYTLKISNLKRTKGGLIRVITINIKNETTEANFNTSSNLPIKVIQILLDKENNSIKIGNLSETDRKVVTGFPSQKAANEYTELKKVKKIITEDELNNALFILDGKEVSVEFIKDLNSDDIDSMSVLKDKNATAVYGDKGKNGVVLITSKEAHEKEKFSNIGKSLSDVNASEHAGSVVKGFEYTSKGRKDLKDPIYLIDGKEASKKELVALKRDDINSVSVLKGEEAIEKYGDKGKNGVIEITTKKK